MRRILPLIAFLFAFPVASQTVGSIQGFCDRGGVKATTSGANSANYLQGDIPSCTITVYLTGTTTRPTLYADRSLTPLANPFTANAVGSAAGKYLFFAATNAAVDVFGSGGIAPNTYPASVPLCIYCFPTSSFSPVVQELEVQTNGVDNTSQAILNHVDTATVKFTNPSGGVESATVPDATSSSKGVVQPDNTTITISGGVISAVRGGINQLHGDATAGPGDGDQSLTLATVNASPGTFGDSTHTVSATVNGKGLITGLASNPIPTGTNAVAGLVEGDTTTFSCISQPCTVVGINGAGLPTSALVVGTNASKQIVAASAADINSLLSGNRPWQSSFTFLGVSSGSQIMLLIPSTIAVTIPSGCSGSYMGATTAANAITDITINKLSGGATGVSSTLCTARFAASGTNATFSGSGGSLAAGDYLEVLGPVSADATLADIGGGIYGTH